MAIFKGQVAVVTGASSGMGRGVALCLAERGATVCLVARRLKELETIASSSRATLSELRPYQTDLSKREDLDRLITRLRTDFQHIDIIVHSAAVYERHRFACAPIADFEIQYRT